MSSVLFQPQLCWRVAGLYLNVDSIVDEETGSCALGKLMGKATWVCYQAH